MISSFLTLKLNGALLIMNITKLSVFMLTISKTSEENQTYSDMTQSYVKTGKVELLLHVMRKGAKD